eukprot:m51a1_g7390 hypothetical protein (299) ;mRNA; r:130574-131674
MKVFVTGATGYIGGEVVKELIAHGHSVTALVRGDASRAPKGSTGIVGTLEKSSEWIPVAVQHEAIIYCAFDLASVVSRGDGTVGAEECLVTVPLAEAAKKAGHTKVMIITTSSGAVINQEGLPDEYSPTNGVPQWLRPRFDGEALFLATSSATFRACSVRPSWVYGGRGGLLKILGDTEIPTVVGDGSAAVSLVSVHDLARLYVFVAENEQCVGAFHGIGDGDYSTWRELATRVSLAKGLQGKYDSIPLEVARNHNGFAELMATSMKAASTRPREMGFVFRDPRLMDAFDTYWKELIC